MDQDFLFQNATADEPTLPISFHSNYGADELQKVQHNRTPPSGIEFGLHQDHRTAIERVTQCEFIIKSMQEQLACKDDHIASLQEKLAQMSPKLVPVEASEDEHRLPTHESTVAMNQDSLFQNTMAGDYHDAIERIAKCEFIIKSMQMQLASKDERIASLEEKLVQMPLEFTSTKAPEDERELLKHDSTGASTNMSTGNDVSGEHPWQQGAATAGKAPGSFQYIPIRKSRRNCRKDSGPSLNQIGQRWLEDEPMDGKEPAWHTQPGAPRATSICVAKHISNDPSEDPAGKPVRRGGFRLPPLSKSDLGHRRSDGRWHHPVKRMSEDEQHPAPPGSPRHHFHF